MTCTSQNIRRPAWNRFALLRHRQLKHLVELVSDYFMFKMRGGKGLEKKAFSFLGKRKPLSDF